MTISLSNLTVNEATPGAVIGTLSGGSNYSIYFDTHEKYYQINGNTLSLTSNAFIDYESSGFVINTSQHTNGVIAINKSSADWSKESPLKVTIKYDSGSGKQFDLNIVDKNEAITLTPTQFKQNKYGATIAQVIPTDSYFLGKDVYLYDAEGSFSNFLEISGTNLKFKDDTYYSETGKILNSSYQLDLTASDYATKDTNSNGKPDNDFFFTMLEGRRAAKIGDSGISSETDIGFTKITASSYLSSIFGSSNINTTAAVTLSAKPFVERDYGSIVATINYSGSETETVTYALTSHSFFEITDTNKIKLKDDYYYDKSDQKIKDQNNSFFPLANMGKTQNILEITASNSADSTKLYTELFNIEENILPTIFASSNVDGTAQITLTPISFDDKKLGAVIAKINYSGSEPPTYTLSGNTGTFFELSSNNKIKLKDDYFFDLNTGSISKKDLSSNYKLTDNSSMEIAILAKDSSNSKNLSSELISLGDITSNVFGTSNVTALDESYTYVTDIKFQSSSLSKTGRKEYQKNITSEWVLASGEKISYSFLEPGASYVGTYDELDGIISPSNAFKAAARSAFNTIASFVNITFEEVSESGDVVGDFRIGITDAQHFGMASDYAAYSQGVNNNPKAGNIFFNGGTDRNNNNVPDYNESSTYAENSRGFTTFLHEIIHSLGHKHPFEAIDPNDTSEGNANIYQNQYEQYPYSIMSYTPMRDAATHNIKYDGVNLGNSGTQYYPKTPMLFDIIALQETYGATQSTGSGDNTYTYLASAPPFESLYDTGGNDILDLSNITGGTQLDLSGSQVSMVGNDYLTPWKNEVGKATVYGTPQGAPLGIIPGTKIEKILLPAGGSTITSGIDSTFIVGKANSAMTVNINATQIGIKASGTANDTINLKQTSSKWTGDFQARNMGNNGKGATEAVVADMTIYLKHDLSLDLKQGSDTIQGTSGNDALFLQNFGTTGDTMFYQDAGSTAGNPRLSGINTINLLGGKNFLDLTSTTTSLAGDSILITSGTDDDILWLSDANENVNSGNGNDQITVNGGTDTLATSLGADIITISKNAGNLTITDFDTSTDKFIFMVGSNKVSASTNVITVDNDDPLGDYLITLSNSPDLSNLSAFSTFA